MTNGTALAEIRTLMELLAKTEICTRGWSVEDGVLQAWLVAWFFRGICLARFSISIFPDTSMVTENRC